MKLTECLDRLLDEGLISNIAVRVGRFDTVLADVYRSAGQKIDENTRFDMASVTKVMVTTPLALMALEQGAITLDTPVSAFFHDPRGLTVRHLLTHTIGIGHKPLNLAGNTYDNIAGHILSIPADIPAGTNVMYSCPGFILLGKILEQIYGRRLDELFMERIAAPLNLTRSRFLPGGEGLAQLRQLDEDHIAKGFLGMVGNAHGNAAVGFQASPFVALGVTQFGGNIAHLVFLEVGGDGGRHCQVRSGACRDARNWAGPPVPGTTCRGFPPRRGRRWRPARGPARWTCSG